MTGRYRESAFRGEVCVAGGFGFQVGRCEAHELLNL